MKKLKEPKNNKKEDNKFKKVNKKHGHKESSRAVFNPKEHEDI